MAIQKRKDGNRVELILDGWIDTLGAPMLASELDALESDVEYLTFEMARLESSFPNFEHKSRCLSDSGAPRD